MKSTTEKLIFIQSIFGRYTLSRDGTDAAVRCPNCKAPPGKRKLSIRLDNDFYHCWVCGIKGRNLINLLKNFARPEILAVYKNDFLGLDPTHFDDDSNDERAFLPKDFSLILNAVQQGINPDFRACLNYLIGRGVTDRDIWFYKLGVSNDPNYRRRIIFPSFNETGNLNFIVSRAIDRYVVPKYMNCNVDRNSIIFNEINVDWNRPIIIVEGPFDLVKAADNAIPLLGSGLSYESKLFQKIIEAQSDVYLALDNDALAKSNRIAKRLLSFGCKVFRVPMDNFSDVGEMTNEQFIRQKGMSEAWNLWSHVMDKIGEISSDGIV